VGAHLRRCHVICFLKTFLWLGLSNRLTRDGSRQKYHSYEAQKIFIGLNGTKGIPSTAARLRGLGILARDDQVDETVDAIIKGTRTGKIGDGNIVVTSIDEVVRIRTGEAGKAAI
jgi:nitrogen regulatory protein PII